MGVRVSQVKPSYCFRLQPTIMISKHSTIPVSDSLWAPRKISFTFHFWHKSLSSLMTWNLQSYPTTVLNERMWHFKGVKIYSDPSYIFSRGQVPNLPDLRPCSCLPAGRTKCGSFLDGHVIIFDPQDACYDVICVLRGILLRILRPACFFSN